MTLPEKGNMIMERLSNMDSVKLTSKIAWWTSDYALNRSFTIPSNTLAIKVQRHSSSTSLTSHPSIHLKSRAQSTARRTESSKPAYLGT
jgi:hypothetical protein